MHSIDIQNSAETRTRFFWLALFLLFAIFFFVDGHDIYQSVREEGDVTEAMTQAEEGSVSRAVSLLLLGTLGIFGLLARDREPEGGNSMRFEGLLGRLMLFFLAWAFLSLLWTEDIGFTFRRLMTLAMLCLGAAAVVRSFSVREVVVMVSSITGAYLALGLGAEIALGTFLPLDPEYRFAGGMNANQQGINCVLLLVGTLFLAQGAGRAQRASLLAAAGLALGLLVLTKSRTSLAVGSLALLAHWGGVVFRRRKTVLVLAGGIMVVLVLFFFSDAISHHLEEGVLLGRSDDPESMTTLTGRVPLWEDCVDFVAKRPFQGYGYGAFWTPRHIEEISASQGWSISSAHSGYVEIALGLGLTGAVACVIIFFLGIGRAFAGGRVPDTGGYRFFGVVLLFGALDGLLESAVVAPSLLCFLCIVALLYLGFVKPDQ